MAEPKDGKAMGRRQVLALGLAGAGAVAAVPLLRGTMAGSALAPQAAQSIKRPLLGTTGTESQFSAATSALGHTRLHYTFQPQLKTSFSQWQAAKCTGHLPLASTKWNNPTQADFNTLMASIPQDGKVRRICPWQEPEDNMSGSAFRSVVAMMRKALGSRRDVLLSLDLMTYSLAAASGRDVTTYMSSDADVIGWSVWPQNGAYATQKTRVQQAAQLCDDRGKAFAVSSFILDNDADGDAAADFVDWMTDFVKTRYQQGKPTDHVVLYTPLDGTGPWLNNATITAAAKRMFTTLATM